MFGANAWRIGRIGGIEIKIDPSWTFIAALIAYTFYAIVAVRFPDEATATLVATAVAMAVIFFASVLIHELAHSWLARSRGVEVRGITLFLFGGATHADLETEDPTDELVIAIVGPFTSLAVAALLWVVTLSLDGGLAAYATGHLGWINLALAVFNLIPGFPLDGGRVLRSLVWRRTGDIVRATRIAARAGQWVGYGLIAVGIFEVLVLGALIGGLWLVAIGWFLNQSAQASFVQLQIKRALADVPASQLMSRDPVEIPADLTVQQAVDDYFMRHNHNAFPVRGPDGVTGILTLNAVREVPREEWGARSVGEAARPLTDACTVDRSDPMDEVLDKLHGNDTNRVVVTSGGDVIGILTSRDLAQWLQRSQELGLTDSLAGGRD